MAPASDPDRTIIDYYELLSISPNATETEIRRAYRKTSLLYHPDKVTSTPETSAKFQLLQVAINVLSDPAEKEKYDQSRAAKQKRAAENAALEGRRRKMKEELEKRESSGLNGAAQTVNGLKRSWTDRELEVKRIAEDNRKRREAMMAAKAQAQATAQAAEVEEAAERSSEPVDRSVKVRWIREGDGLLIDQASLIDMCAKFGEVENVVVLKDKKRRIDGRDKKVVLGTALVVFASLNGAKKAIAGGAWDGIESISWAAEKEEPS